MIFMFFIIIMIMIFFVFSFFMKFYNINSKEKNSPFECGFDPFSMSRVPFSLKFFLIGIIFLIFDVEIVVILPFPFLIKIKNLFYMYSFIGINILILLGLFYELNYSMINWLK
uniref:NADH-ubiquinone oxidoreductase chain 3 n=1 Tax=Hyalomma scupense TaxID=1260755 RepID=A0A8E7DLU9_HYASC|nr:NADH dehydrogenase subunit 3 [Hyalomma scupense]QVV23871.1 NADH dehydrogenase subunit 3 [Hyalomma scupense]UNO54319.1 NADH dehydrogenase subunit 3 [Hyalomma scupense]